MSATINLEKEKHFPVLLDELVSIISPHYGGTFIDCTFGQGGYSKKILEHGDNKIIGLDRDADTIKNASWFKENYKDRFYFENKRFSEINNLETKIENLKAVIFDLGYSLNQIKDPNKGLSFNSTGKLNMKMGLNSFSANEVINNLDQKGLEKIFKFFGEETKYKLISKKIVEFRKNDNLITKDLIKIRDRAIKTNASFISSIEDKLKRYKNLDVCNLKRSNQFQIQEYNLKAEEAKKRKDESIGKQFGRAGKELSDGLKKLTKPFKDFYEDLKEGYND